MNKQITYQQRNQIIQVLETTHLFDRKQLTEAEITPLGGLSNQNFKITVNQNIFAMRAPSKDIVITATDRVTEQYNSKLMSLANINVDIIYQNKNGLLLTNFLNHSKVLTTNALQNTNIFLKLIKTIKQIHSHTQRFKNNRSITNDISILYKHVSCGNSIYHNKLKQLDTRMRKIMSVINNTPINTVPCHYDLSKENILVTDNNEIKIIDWEYSGNFDPYFDLTYLLLDLDCDEQLERKFLQEYGGLTTEIITRMSMYKPLIHYLSALWCKARLDHEHSPKEILRKSIPDLITKCENALDNIC